MSRAWNRCVFLHGFDDVASFHGLQLLDKHLAKGIRVGIARNCPRWMNSGDLAGNNTPKRRADLSAHMTRMRCLTHLPEPAPPSGASSFGRHTLCRELRPRLVRQHRRSLLTTLLRPTPRLVRQHGRPVSCRSSGRLILGSPAFTAKLGIPTLVAIGALVDTLTNWTPPLRGVDCAPTCMDTRPGMPFLAQLTLVFIPRIDMNEARSPRSFCRVLSQVTRVCLLERVIFAT